jgi:acyl-CoA hydrolase
VNVNSNIFQKVATAYPACEVAPNIIAQINPHVPRTHGTAHIHMNCFKYVVHVDDPLPEHLPGEPNEVEKAIGKHIAGLVDDGATLQMGIGEST